MQHAAATAWSGLVALWPVAVADAAGYNTREIARLNLAHPDTVTTLWVEAALNAGEWL